MQNFSFDGHNFGMQLLSGDVDGFAGAADFFSDSINVDEGFEIAFLVSGFFAEVVWDFFVETFLAVGVCGDFFVVVVIAGFAILTESFFTATFAGFDDFVTTFLTEVFADFFG